MPRLLKHRAFVTDPWTRTAEDDDRLDAGGSLLLPLARWQEQRTSLLALPPERLGIWLPGEEDPDTIGADATRFGCIAIHFPAFMDGRGFSCGRLLRERHGYRGELRACGDIIPDQLHYLWRCGFDAFELPDEVSLETALSCLDAFSDHYQQVASWG